MPQLLLFLPSLHSLTSMVLRFINSLFMTSAAIKKRKRTGRIQFFCAWPSSLSWFVFCLPSFCFFAFKNLCVATMHEAGVSFTSSLPFYCFYLFLCFCLPLDLGTVGKVSFQEGGTAPDFSELSRTFQNFCMRTLSSIPSLMSQSLHCCREKRKRGSKSRKRQSTSSYWLSHASTEQHANPVHFSRGSCCPVPAPVTLGH